MGAGAEALARLLADVGTLAAWLPSGFAQRLAPLLAFAPPQARPPANALRVSAKLLSCFSTLPYPTLHVQVGLDGDELCLQHCTVYVPVCALLPFRDLHPVAC